jgi:hypothetical protein
MVFLTKTNGYQKLCDRNNNVIKMGVIIKGVYCTFTHTKKKKKVVQVGHICWIFNQRLLININTLLLLVN